MRHPDLARLCCAALCAIAFQVLDPPPLRAAEPPPLERMRDTVRTASGSAVPIERGRLMVPENRAVPGSRLIPVGFVRLLSRAANPAPPLFFLPGGPGNTATGAADDPQALEAWAPLLDVADVVLIDPRGTRDRDLAYRWDGPLPLAFFQSADSARAQWQAMSRAALAAYRRRGVDIHGYTTLECVADVEALRRALGFDRIALLGFSWGTHLALAYLRAHDAHVSRAVLVGVEGPDHTLKLPDAMEVQFRRLALRAAEDSAIAALEPDLVALLDRVDAKLAKSPMRITIESADGSRLELPVGPFGLHLILRADIGDASDLPVFPRLLHDIDRGDPSTLQWFVRKRSGFAVGVPGMGIMTDAQSDGSPARHAQIDAQRGSRFADVVNFPFPEITPLWVERRSDPSLFAPIVTGVPTLFLSGEFDWNAPPQQAEAVRWGFAHATHLIVANAGHEQTLWQNPETVPVVRDFLAGQDVSGARLAWRPLQFVPLEGPLGAVTHPSLGQR